jgi:cation diffusion facilitator family transporter
MHRTKAEELQHNHFFGQVSSESEKRTRLVVGLTLVMMILEIAFGLWTGSMALLADGWHMGTHAGALGISLLAYWYARRHAEDRRFAFGTGKVGILGGYSSAIVLGIVALLMLYESVHRLIWPVDIRFGDALLVAVIGLAVNLVSAWLLTAGGHSHHHHHHGGDEGVHGHAHSHGHGHDHVHHDTNLRAAYLHVLADALTSVLAIVALLAGWLWGWAWMDPVMGILGVMVISKWAWGLLWESGHLLLDCDVHASGEADQVRAVIEADEDSAVSDLHIWPVGTTERAAIVSVVSHTPRRPDDYRQLLSQFPNLKHVTIEVHSCPADAADHSVV